MELVDSIILCFRLFYKLYVLQNFINKECALQQKKKN
jgi:hypothetical protein